ncbi:hypothetical protein [Flavobacterium sp. HJJ]|uniref:hypothetical protein n=1 Tax=Flavobacterium sp. HJJ TaxID=2783792 RepID=UPI00188AF5AD|nr:hypothetical protein [Flavobacterium sp. HJJ]MBF4471858.1 hypothetical protein [Flavobacterium sp. HJJ]
MKKLIFTVFLFLCVTISSTAQTNNSATEFYFYLNSILKNKNNKSIQLSGTNYGAIGSKFIWEAKFQKNGKKVEIQYSSQKPSEDDSIIMTHDTTFVTYGKQMIQNFKTEITAIESRPVYFEETVKIIVKTADSNKEFIVKRADGLPFLLRYNRSFEEYYKGKNEKRKNK